MSIISIPVVDDEFKSLAKILNVPSLSNFSVANGSNQGPWIAGGIARCLWYNIPWKSHDVDLFFQNKEQYQQIVGRVSKLHEITTDITRRFVDLDRASQIPSDEFILCSKKSISFADPHKTNNAISYKMQLGDNWPNLVTVQAINKKWHNTLIDLWNDFDFNVCKFATDGQIIIADESAIRDCTDKVLRRNESCSIKLSPKRVMKYSIYGFDAEPNIMREILMQHKDKSIFDEANDDDY